MRFDLTVSQFAWELATGRPLQVYDADTWRPYCHVRDIARAVMTVLAASGADVRGEVFNVGDTSQQFTKRMIVDEVRKHLADVSRLVRGGRHRPAQLPGVLRQDRRLGWGSAATTPCRTTSLG